MGVAKSDGAEVSRRELGSVPKTGVLFVVLTFWGGGQCPRLDSVTGSIPEVPVLLWNDSMPSTVEWKW